MIMTNGTHYALPSTLTIGATNSTGSAGIVVAGHGLELKPGFSFVHHQINASGIDTMITAERVPVFNSGSVDAAFIPITEPNIIVGSKVKSHNGTIFEITHGNLTNVPRGDDLTIYGINNNGDGSLFLKEASVTSDGQLFTDMGIAFYPSIRGDSGAAIIHHSNGESKIVGVHKGGACIFESPSEGQTFVEFLPKTTFCTVDNYTFKLFSAWENVKTTLNLR